MLASEFNDFGGDLERHSYEACLTNIEMADYFVLLVGARVGGWYDEPNRISITRQEYRTAYEHHLKGKLKLVTFVRDEVWQFKEDRKELTRFLAQCDMTDRERKIAAAAPSKFANDAEFVAAFLNEVGRNLETGQAVKLGSVKPTGNWIHRFRDFRDIHDVLSPLAFTGLTSEEAAFRKALQSELLSVMSRLVAKSDGKVLDLSTILKSGLKAHPITPEMRDHELMAVDLKAWNSFSSACYQILSVRFETVVIDAALTSTIFLDYDATQGVYIQTATYDAVAKLWSEIRMFNELNTSETFSILIETSPRSMGYETGIASISTHKVAQLYSLTHRWINIVSLCRALILHLSGQPFQPPEQMPFSPINGFEESIMAERVNITELRAALGIS